MNINIHYSIVHVTCAVCQQLGKRCLVYSFRYADLYSQISDLFVKFEGIFHVHITHNSSLG